MPSWPALADGARPPSSRDPENNEPGATRSGWQHEAAVRVEQQLVSNNCSCVFFFNERALLRSQSGPGSLSRPPTHWFGSIRKSSECFCCVASVFPSPCPGVSADVAVSLTNLAIIVQLALEQGFWETRVCLERVWRPACAVKVAPGLRPTCSSATLIWTCPTQPEDGRRLGSRPHSNTTAWLGAGDGDGVVLEIGWTSERTTYQDPRSPRRHSRACLAGFWLRRWGGRWSEETQGSSDLWPRHVPDQNSGCCASERNRLGECDGGHLLSCAAPTGIRLLLGRFAERLWRGCPTSFDVEADFCNVALD